MPPGDPPPIPLPTTLTVPGVNSFDPKGVIDKAVSQVQDAQNSIPIPIPQPKSTDNSPTPLNPASKTDNPYGDPLSVGSNEQTDLIALNTRKAAIAQQRAQVLQAAQDAGAYYDPSSKKFLDQNGDPLPLDSRLQAVKGQLDQLDVANNQLDDFRTAIKDMGTIDPKYKAVQQSASDAITSYLKNEGLKTAEVTRQLDDYIKRAKAVYDLQNSEQQQSMDAQDENMKLMKWEKDNGQLVPGASLYFTPPPSYRLSSALRSSVPDTVAPDYRGMAAALGLPTYAEGTPPIQAPSMQASQPVSSAGPVSAAPSPAAPQAGASFAGPPAAPPIQQAAPPPVSTPPVSTPSAPPPNPTGTAPGTPGEQPAPPPTASAPMSSTPVTSPFTRDRLSNIMGPRSAGAFDRIQVRQYIDASVKANMMSVNPAQEKGVPAARDVTVGQTTIPARIVAMIGKGSMPMSPPPQNFRWLRQGEGW